MFGNKREAWLAIRISWSDAQKSSREFPHSRVAHNESMKVDETADN